ncbi:MAG: hypothetical protein M3Y54_15905 [Bacteroidota bacterium]|nr:hypothetical protein [Bacteroidota bacterium]
MPTPLAETLTQLRVGNQKFLIDFYQRSRHLFERWAQRQHRLAAPQAHQLLQDTLLDFYDQVADGRITKLADDLRAFIYGMAQQRVAAQVPAQVPLPAAEARRRQRLLTQFHQIGADCQQLLTYFYFRNYRFEQVGVKMGFPNAAVARRQKSICLRKLYELVRGGYEPAGWQPGSTDAASPPATPPRVDLRPHLDELERFADGQMTLDEQDAFELRLEHEEDLAEGHAAYEQLTADLRWAAGHDTLHQRLQSLDERMNERGSALVRAQRLAQRRQRRFVLLAALAGVLVLAAGMAFWYFSQPNRTLPARHWEAYYQPDPGPPVTATLLSSNPLFGEALDQYQSGHYQAALHSLGRVSPASVGADTLLYLRGLILLRQGQGNAAQLYLQRLSKTGGSGELARRARYHLGMAYWQAQELAPALTELRAVAADSLNPYRASARRAVAAGVLEVQ